MKRIKLREFLNLTEQAPQPPTDVPAPGMNAGGSPDGQEQPPTDDSNSESSPSPEDPGEYDFTKDFRSFEDKKNKAESESKKILLKQMNEKLLNKTIIANASRGYGQPKTDYTIKNVKKVSVEFWYKDYVVIVSDENDKKYFLTPGINIKIEGGETNPTPESGEVPQGGSVPGKEESPNNTEQPQGLPTVPSGGEEPEQPSSGQPEVPSPEVPLKTPQQSSVPSKNPNPPVKPTGTPTPQTPSAPGQEQEPEQPEDPRKKKKVPPVAEWVQQDLSKFLLEFMSNNVKGKNGKVNFIPYIKKAIYMLSENVNSTKVKCSLVIPENHMKNVDNREIKLAAVEVMRQRSKFGQYTNGSVNIERNGRYYLLEYIKEVGRNV